MSGPRILKVQGGGLSEEARREAVAALGAGEVVAHPTETLYGLAVDPWNEKAVAGLVALKGRASGSGMILIVESAGAAARLAHEPPEAFHRLARAFWPGPLTLILREGAAAPRAVLGASGGVAVRHTSDPVARALVEAHGRALTSTSANRTGGPPAETAAGIAALFPSGVALILDAGARPAGPPSTLVDLRGARPRIVREGAVARERIEEALQRR